VLCGGEDGIGETASTTGDIDHVGAKKRRVHHEAGGMASNKILGLRPSAEHHLNG
jgi:hypothetical protein